MDCPDIFVPLNAADFARNVSQRDRPGEPAPPPQRAPIATRASTVFIVGNSRTSCNKNSRGKRPSDPEAQAVEPVVGGEPVAARGAQVPRVAVPGTAAD